MKNYLENEDSMISVIVPVYNVEKYLKRCVDSIFNQTYKDFEIILVDDGSNDSSGEICDKYDKNNKNVRVIHQNNIGLSGARNTGIKYSKGEYLTFIDSDDYIDGKYLEILYGNLIKCDADISCCDYLRTSADSEKAVYSKKCIALKNDDSIKFYLEKDIVSDCGKLYKKELFNSIKFPVGKINEDISTIFKVFMNVKRVTWNDSKLYFYYRNLESITTSCFKLKNLDLLDARRECLILSKKYDPVIQKLAQFRLDKSYFQLLGMIAYYGVSPDIDVQQFSKIKNDLVAKFKDTFMDMLFSKYIPISRKIAMVLFRINFDLCCWIWSNKKKENWSCCNCKIY